MEESKSTIIPTPLGDLYAVADPFRLHLLTFEIGNIPAGKNGILNQLELELEQYFLGKLRAFKTPLLLRGTPFQIDVWNELLKIPFGTRCSYREIAKKLNNSNASRAVGNANGKNPFAILVPCHRVIAKSTLGGYRYGIGRKKWLLKFERIHS